MLELGKAEEATMAKLAHLRAVAPRPPATLNGKVPAVPPPRRVPNRERRTREHLTPAEAERLIGAAGKVGRHGYRDSALLLLTYRHGLRVGELIALRWEQVDLKQGLLHVNRLKHGVDSTHPLRGPELRALRKLQRDSPSSPYLFSSERRGPMTAANVRKMTARAGEVAKIGFSVHPH